MKISLAFAHSCGQTIPLSSSASIMRAARANPTLSFLWRRVADAFLVCITTSMACCMSASSAPFPCEPLHTVSSLLSSALMISG